MRTLRRVLAMLAIATLIAAALTFLPASPASAADRCDLSNATHRSAWGCHRGWYSGGYFQGQIDDALTDGACVNAYTIDSWGNKKRWIARSCGAPKWFSTQRQSGETGVRVFRWGNYHTIIRAET